MRRLFVGLLLAVVLTAQADIPTNTRIQAFLTPSGKVDTRYRDGDDGAAEIPLLWGACPNISVLSGTPASFNLRTNCSLQEAGSPDATLTTNCSPSLGSGWSNATDGLSYSGTGNLSASCQTSAVRSGVTALSNFFTIVSQAPPSSDDTAPTVPRGVGYTAQDGAIKFDFDASADIYDGEAPSGLDHYNLRRNGSIVHAIPASDPGISCQLTKSNLGSPSPTPTWSQSTTGGTLVSEGSIANGTADRGVLVSCPVTGDFTLSAKFASITNGDGNAKCQLTARETTAAGSKYIAWGPRNTASTRLQSRTATDLAAAGINGTSATAALQGNHEQLQRSGNTWISRYAANELGWTEFAQTTNFSLANALQVGVHLDSESAGVATTCVLQQFAITTTARETYTYTTSSSGSFTLSAVDADGNESAQTTALVAAPLDEPPVGAAHKWNPGHYIGTYDRNGAAGSLTSQIAEVVAMKAIDSNVKGIGLWYNWRHLEPTKNNYNFSTLIANLNQIHAAGLKAYLYIESTSFNASERHVPDYLTSEPGGSPGIYTRVAVPGSVPALWTSAIMDRYIALHAALAAAVENHPAMELISETELTVGFSTNEYAAANYSDAAYLAQWIRFAPAVAALFPTTNIVAPANFFGDPTYMDEYVEAMYQAGIGVGGPDVFPQAPYVFTGTSDKTPTWTDQILRGKRWDGANWVAGGLRDYRGKMVIANQVQDPEMGKSYTWPPRAFHEYAKNIDGLAITHLYWWRKDYAFSGNPPPDQETYWNNSTLQPSATLRVKAYLTNGTPHPVFVTCPENYASRGGCAP